MPLWSRNNLDVVWMLFVEAGYDDDDDDGVIDVSVTSRNHGDHDDDVRDQWRHSARHHHDNNRGMINTVQPTT